MDTIKSMWEMLMSVWEAVNLPAGIAMIISIFTTQTLKQVRDIPAWAVRSLSFFTTILLFLAYCYAVKIPIRDAVTMGNAIIAGVAGPILIALLKKYGLDPDKMYGGSPTGE